MNPTTAKGTFIWHELSTTDHHAAFAFYSAVLGWSRSDSEMSGPGYTIAVATDHSVAGLLTLTPEMCASGARPLWMSYIGVADVDATLVELTAAGGKVHLPAHDLPGVGRMAMVTDPQGVPFMLMTPFSKEPMPVVAPGSVGHVGWNELHANDGVQAFAFYSSMFGWTPTSAMDMGTMGIYQLFSTGAAPVGGMMTRTPDLPAPMWIFYFNVDRLDPAIERVKAAGGTIVLEPHEVPGPMWITQGFDPQGALFALVAPQR